MRTHVAAHLDAGGAEHALASPPAATRAVVSRALARSSTFAQVVGQVLERAREVGVAGPRVLERAPRFASGGCGSGDITSPSSRGPCCG
jgi:hypothetical protein